MAQTFFPITPTECTPDEADKWDTCDVSGSIPSGATGVILHVVNATAGVRRVGFRKNGSTDDRYPYSTATAHFWVAIGVDASRIFEAWLDDITNIDVYLVGYTKAGVTFKTNADDMSLSTLNEWTAIDCSTEAPSAIGLIFEGLSTASYAVGFRKNGSSDDRYSLNYRRLWTIIGCDASQICEGYISNAAYDFFLVGYITDGATFNLNATDVSLGTADEWLDLTALPATANMGFIEVISSDAYAYGLRKNGSAEDIYLDVGRHYWGFVE